VAAVAVGLVLTQKILYGIPVAAVAVGLDLTAVPAQIMAHQLPAVLEVQAPLPVTQRPARQVVPVVVVALAVPTAEQDIATVRVFLFPAVQAAARVDT
jgi:hypothetical protein